MDPSRKLRWLVLAVGGTLLILLLGSGILATRFLQRMHTQQQAVTHALAERTQMLSSLWSSVQGYSEAVRQYVTQARARPNQAARQHLDELTLEIDSSLKHYPDDRDSIESALLDGMQDVFLQQRTLFITVVTAKPAGNQHRVQNFSTKEMDSSQELQKKILDWTGMYQTWSGQRLQNADAAMVAEFGNLQRGLSRALTIGFTSGLLFVLGSMAYIMRLERQTHQRYLELVRTQQESKQLSSRLLDAQETERRSISRELHDEVGQALGALLVDIGRLSTTLSNDRPEVKTQLDNMKSVAERTFQSVRNIALLLRPSMLDDLGLIAALEWQGREVSRRSEIEVAVESENIPENLPDDYGICIYRFVQEALNNTVRHSGARNAKVTAGRTGNSILVRVSDDGRGFDPNRARGLGLLGMEERVKRLAGTFNIQSKPGQGVTLTAELPFPPPGEEPA